MMTEHSKFLQARIVQLEAALTMMYDKWENGDSCYEDPDTCGGFLGNAFKLSQEEENQVLALIGPGPDGPVEYLVQTSYEPREDFRCKNCDKPGYLHVSNGHGILLCPSSDGEGQHGT